MNAELKAKWLTALRSGEYLQGEGRLFNSQDNSYCCLGVLCDISGVGDWDGRAYYVIEGIGSGWLLPTGMALDIFGTTTDLPDGYYAPDDYANQDGTLPFKGHEGTVSLTALNDSGQFTFDQIADVIEWAF